MSKVPENIVSFDTFAQFLDKPIKVKKIHKSITLLY